MAGVLESKGVMHTSIAAWCYCHCNRRADFSYAPSKTLGALQLPNELVDFQFMQGLSLQMHLRPSLTRANHSSLLPVS